MVRFKDAVGRFEKVESVVGRFDAVVTGRPEDAVGVPVDSVGRLGSPVA